MAEQEQKAVRGLQAFLLGSQGVSEEHARACWEAVSPLGVGTSPESGAARGGALA